MTHVLQRGGEREGGGGHYQTTHAQTNYSSLRPQLYIVGLILVLNDYCTHVLCFR
jgi:hypothetical protein